MTGITVYAIANCDKVKKARAWLDAHAIAYAFHDYKKHGVDEALLRNWVAEEGWQALVNTQGTTWRQLDDKVKAGVTGDKAAITLMMQKPSVIRRPITELRGKRIIGWDEAAYATAFGKAA